MNKIIVAGVIAAGGYVAWSLFRASQAAAQEDPFGNPQGTVYDEEGIPDSSPTWSLEQDVSPAVLQGVILAGRQNDRTVPATAGGLRYHASSRWYDSRLVAYGQLALPLEAKAAGISVMDDPNHWRGPARGGTASPYLWGPSTRVPPSQKFETGKIYRLIIEEEPIVALCRGKLRTLPGKYFAILDRPNMTNRRIIHTPSYREFDSEEERDRWPQYTGANPVYPLARPDQWVGDVYLAGDGEPVWVQELRGNCAAEDWADVGPNRIWDPELGTCREMNAAEIAAQEAWEDEREATEEAESAASRAAAEARCQKWFGLSCGDWRRLALWEGRTDYPSTEEREARIQAVKERTDFSMPADIGSDLWFPQYTGASSGRRALPLPVDSGGDTVDLRRDRGRRFYRALPWLQKREFRRDIFSLLRGRVRFNGRTVDGETLISAVGGYHGLAAIWGPPRPYEARVQTTRMMR